VGAFSSSALTSLTISKSVKVIERWACAKCKRLSSVIIPEGAWRIEDGAFFGCVNLTSMAIPDTVESIGALAFRNCTRLASVTIGSRVSRIDNEAFLCCSSLTNIVMPDSIRCIGNAAFRLCSNLRAIYFKGDAPSRGKFVFDGADNVTVFFKPGTKGWKESFAKRPTKQLEPQS